jgi:hypothetical protein
MEGVIPRDFGTWKGVLIGNLSKQTDDCSCGVFTAAFAELLLRGFGPPFPHVTMENVPAIRVGMAHLLLQRHEHQTSCVLQDREISSKPWL